MKKIKYHIEIIKTSRYCYINAILDDTNERVGKLCIDLDSEDSNIYKKYNEKVAKIILVHTNKSYCKNGIATSLLNKTIKLFNDYYLYLNVIPLRSDKDKEGLIKFYSKFGFERYKDNVCTLTMFRKNN